MAYSMGNIYSNPPANIFKRPVVPQLQAPRSGSSGYSMGNIYSNPPANIFNPQLNAVQEMQPAKYMDTGGVAGRGGVSMIPPGGFQPGPQQDGNNVQAQGAVKSQDPNSDIADLLKQMQAAGMQNHPGFAQLSAYANQGQQGQPQQPLDPGPIPQQYQPQRVPGSISSPIMPLGQTTGQQQTYPYQMPQQDGNTGQAQWGKTMDVGGGVGMMPPGGWQRGPQQDGKTDQAQGLQPGYGQPSQAGAGNPFTPIPNYGTNYSPNSLTNRQTQGFNMKTS